MAVVSIVAVDVGVRVPDVRSLCPALPRSAAIEQLDGMVVLLDSDKL